MEQIHNQHAKIFKAFADENRLAILELLRSGEKCACKLIDKLGVGQSSISYRMKILCDAGVVNARQEGKWTHYCLNEVGCEEVVKLLDTLTTTDSKVALCEKEI